jgi:hypothetical protein
LTGEAQTWQQTEQGVRHTIGASETAALKGAHAAMVIPTVPGSLRRWRIPAGLLSLLIVGSLAAPLTALAAISSVIVGAQVQDPVTAGNVVPLELARMQLEVKAGTGRKPADVGDRRCPGENR